MLRFPHSFLAEHRKRIFPRLLSEGNVQVFPPLRNKHPMSPPLKNEAPFEKGGYGGI